MKIAIGNDHAAVEMKNHIMDYLKNKGFEVVNFGSDTAESVDYPIYGEKVANAVANGECDFGILICGTGVGISLAANKVKGIRAAVCSEPMTARLCREHNNANVITFGDRITGLGIILDCVKLFLETEFLGGRHEKRVNKITEVENKYFK